MKELRINLILKDYEKFFLKPDETISKMNDRFTDSVNNLKALGQNISE